MIEEENIHNNVKKKWRVGSGSEVTIDGAMHKKGENREEANCTNRCFQTK